MSAFNDLQHTKKAEKLVEDSNDVDPTTIGGSDKVKCDRCLSEVLLKNLKQHYKTKKCIAAVNGESEKKPLEKKEKKEAKALVSESCVGTLSLKKIPKEKVIIPSSSSSSSSSSSGGSSHEDDEEDFEESVLDDLDSLHEKVDHLIEIVSQVLGMDIHDIPEGKEEKMD